MKAALFSVLLISATSIYALPARGQTGSASYNQSAYFNSGGSPSAAGQNFPGASLGNLLNEVDQKSYWQQTPLSGNIVKTPAAGLFSPSAPPASKLSQTPFSPASSPFSPQGLLRIFLEGGSGGYSGYGGNSAEKQARDASITGQSESLYSRASNQAAQAEADERTASRGSGYDRGTREGAASSAQYHANDARAAAEQAESLTYSSSEYAKEYASRARAEANRAQAAADRARYNASQ